LLVQANESIQQSMSIENISPGSFYACRYENEWYFGVANYVSVENSDVHVIFLHPKGPAVQFFWPSRDDICWIPINDIVTKVEAPVSGSTGRFYRFEHDDVKRVQCLVK